jgi:malonyl-CoA O-methyltransferase
MPEGVFVTGTDTGIGKTLVAACLVRRWHADYWKPAQTGLAEEPGDTETVSYLAALPPHRRHPPAHAFQAPLSVEAAAALEGATVSLADFTVPRTAAPLVVEGAGGVLVPIAPGVLMIDLIAQCALPVIVVARTALGTINHTLLTLAALRARDIQIAGVILVGDPSPGNAEAIARHGATRILHELRRLPAVTPETVAAASAAFPDFATAIA